MPAPSTPSRQAEPPTTAPSRPPPRAQRAPPQPPGPSGNFREFSPKPAETGRPPPLASRPGGTGVPGGDFPPKPPVAVSQERFENELPRDSQPSSTPTAQAPAWRPKGKLQAPAPAPADPGVSPPPIVRNTKPTGRAPAPAPASNPAPAPTPAPAPAPAPVSSIVHEAMAKKLQPRETPVAQSQVRTHLYHTVTICS